MLKLLRARPYCSRFYEIIFGLSGKLVILYSNARVVFDFRLALLI